MGIRRVSESLAMARRVYYAFERELGLNSHFSLDGEDIQPIDEVHDGRYRRVVFKLLPTSLPDQEELRLLEEVGEKSILWVVVTLRKTEGDSWQAYDITCAGYEHSGWSWGDFRLLANIDDELGWIFTPSDGDPNQLTLWEMNQEQRGQALTRWLTTKAVKQWQEEKNWLYNF